MQRMSWVNRNQGNPVHSRFAAGNVRIRIFKI